jgi:hypothetical protein
MATPPDFSVGQVLTSTVMSTVGLWELTGTISGSGVSVTSAGIEFSASTEIIVDDVFTANFRYYRILLDMRTSAGGGIITFELRNATPSTVTTNYKTRAIDSSGSTISTRTEASTSLSRIGANDTNAYHTLEMVIFAPYLALPTRYHSVFNRNNATVSESVWGAQTATTSMEGFRIAVSTGNMTGLLKIYGYN